MFVAAEDLPMLIEHTNRRLTLANGVGVHELRRHLYREDKPSVVKFSVHVGVAFRAHPLSQSLIWRHVATKLLAIAELIFRH